MKTYASEYLSKDILEDDFIKVFSFLHFLQKLCGSCRVDARDRFVTAPTKSQKLYTLLCLLMISSIGCAGVYMESHFLHEYPVIFYTTWFGMLTGIFAHFCNIVYVRFFNCQDNVNFYIMIQKLDRIMKIEHSKNLLRFMCYSNMIMILDMGICLLALILSACDKQKITMICLGVSLNNTALIIEMRLCNQILMYFGIRMRFINSILINHIQSYINYHESCSLILTEEILKKTAAETHDFLTSHTDIYLKKIFDTFHKFQDLFRLQILLLYFNTICYTINASLYVAYGTQNNIITIYNSMAIVSLLLIYYVESTCLSINSISFLNEIQKTKRLSITLMSLHLSEQTDTKEGMDVTPQVLNCAIKILTRVCINETVDRQWFRGTMTSPGSRSSLFMDLEKHSTSSPPQNGPLRKKAKNMYKTITETSPRFSIYDMWEMDGRLVIKVLQTVTSLIVIQMQFTLL